MAAFQHSPTAPLPTSEIFGPTMNTKQDLRMPRISYGLPFDRAILNHVEADARVFIIASKSLAGTTDALTRLESALGARVRGKRIGMTSHTYFHECVEVANQARAVHADTIVTLGGGSLADAAKFVCKALTNDLSSVEQLKQFNMWIQDGKMRFKEGNPVTARLICIPTTLSAGEHTHAAGITDAATRQKYQIPTHPAHVTILDPQLAVHTPPSIWLQSGVRALDHCVENMLSPDAFGPVDAACLQGLRLLIVGLLGTVHDAGDVAARLNAQLGAALAILPLLWNVSAGASHGIGHMLGPMGVGHGETSCILLPAVCKYNQKATGARQGTIGQALWDIPEAKRVFEAKRLDPGTADLGDLLDAVIRALGMPRTLKERGIEGNRVDELAEMSLNDMFMATNPVPITTKEQVMEILNMVRG